MSKLFDEIPPKKQKIIIWDSDKRLPPFPINHISLYVYPTSHFIHIHSTNLQCMQTKKSVDEQRSSQNKNSIEKNFFRFRIIKEYFKVKFNAYKITYFFILQMKIKPSKIIKNKRRTMKQIFTYNRSHNACFNCLLIIRYTLQLCIIMLDQFLIVKL